MEKHSFANMAEQQKVNIKGVFFIYQLCKKWHILFLQVSINFWVPHLPD
jgi:hypothetical protein